MKPNTIPAERELEGIKQKLIQQIMTAQELFGKEKNELRTSQAALKLIEEHLQATKKEQTRQKR